MTPATPSATTLQRSCSLDSSRETLDIYLAYVASGSCPSIPKPKLLNVATLANTRKKHDLLTRVEALGPSLNCKTHNTPKPKPCTQARLNHNSAQTLTPKPKPGLQQAQADSAKRVTRLAQVAHNAFRKHGRLTYFIKCRVAPKGGVG